MKISHLAKFGPSNSSLPADFYCFGGADDAYEVCQLVGNMPFTHFVGISEQLRISEQFMQNPVAQLDTQSRIAYAKRTYFCECDSRRKRQALRAWYWLARQRNNTDLEYTEEGGPEVAEPG